MTRATLSLLFLAILVAMLTVTTYASFDRSIFNVGSELTSDPWFRATLADAYLGFVTFYVWVVYKERSLLPRCIWFLLIMTLGNIAMSIYVLLQLARWDPALGVESLLLRSSRRTSHRDAAS